MAQNHDIQNKLRNELTESLLRNDNQLSYEMILEMKYLNMVLSETLRKYPPIPLSMRRCTQKYRIPNTSLEVPQGVTVMVPILAIHLDENYYPDPQKFDPERFNDENVNNRPAFTYLPFGELI